MRVHRAKSACPQTPVWTDPGQPRYRFSKAGRIPVRRHEAPSIVSSLRASSRPGVSVAPSTVWQLARCRRIESLTSRRFPRGSASSYRCHASSRRVPTPALTTGVVPHEGFFSGCCCARRSGLASTPCSSRWCQAVNRERTQGRHWCQAVNRERPGEASQ